MDPDALRLARVYLEREMALGLELLPRAGAPAAEARAAANIAALRSGATVAAPGPAPADARTAAAGATPQAPAVSSAAAGTRLGGPLVEQAIVEAVSLEQLRGVLGECTRCKLCSGRTNIVFGVGNPAADLMFVGEGPGEDEDVQGEPFVGKAGKLLTDIITRGMGLKRSDVYIANVVKCRPPSNRNPEPDEIVACEPFLLRQVELVSPKVLVSLGNFATQALLRDRTSITRRRGQWHEFAGIPLMPTFHPAYLLRNPSDKRLVWDDIKQVMARLGLPLPQRGGG
ncbi:MAG TPA: uracil-DNA glycosylase [Candidatus Limnocylindrales bacterium]|nr:uracil-DNA glycosylase [Candidatus Limnocylindrales bacterium]